MAEQVLARFAGINNQDAPERINSFVTTEKPYIELQSAVNVDVDDAMRLSRRTGQTLKVAGAAHSLWAKDDVCLFVQDGAMAQLNSDFTSRTLAEGLTDAPMAYVQAGRRVYHSNGTQTGVFDDGVVRSWGLDLAQINISASPTHGYLPAGVYLFGMTLLRFDGQESGMGLSLRIDLTEGQGIDFAWALPDDPDVDAVAIYLSQPNGQTLYQAIICQVEDQATTYTGGERAIPLATQWLDAPPPGQALVLHAGRIYIAAGAFLYATAALSFEHCDMRDFLGVDQTPIALLASVVGGLFVGTERSVYFLAGTDFAGHALKPVMDGAVMAGSLVMVDGQQATARPELAGLQCALFTTAAGIVLGLPDGSLQNLTQGRYGMPAMKRAPALFQKTPFSSQYLLSPL